MAITLTSGARDAMCDALTALPDVSGPGNLVIMTSGDVEVATLALSATSFGASVAGVCTAAAISDDTSATGGTAALHKFEDGAALESWRGTVQTSGGDLTLSTLSIGVGDTVQVSSYTVTVPAS